MREALSMSQLQAASLEVLHRVAEVCDLQGFRYSLVYGTLIGAIRHKGYIPWDDDVDIMMPRPDYDCFLEYFKTHQNDFPNLKLFNRDECPQYPYMISRVSDERYEIVVENEKPYGMGVFIDIYPYDGLGNTSQEALSFGLKGDRLSSFCYQSTRNHYAVETTKSVIRKFLKYPVFLFAKMIGKDYFQRKLDALARVKSYESSEYVGCVVWLTGGAKDIFKREWFDELIDWPFEKYHFKVPKRFDEVLKLTYGDYMQLPPEEDRIGHHYFKAYKKE
ncbi:lipopolysaccharide cholinephosphotransferase [Fibrobacter sp. UWH5]|uniref:LicD family protein n=1 Tax=Fibrobacter sp. UWH5 TaxID=1896211 RepID=UPI000917C625|nr:LicD family protein [Fibrobacter sp. UWH5]SHL04625.1 lipopolysaccharide cholinephosphotransferase [Fibrobacter sp. UWH5]